MAAGAAFYSSQSIIDGLETTIELAREAEVTQKRLAAQLATSGVAFANVKDQIEESNLALSRLSGFSVDELDQSLITLVRSTGDVNNALRINEIAADVARGRHIKLSVAAIALGKAYYGQTTALKRLGIQVPANLKGMEALEFVSGRFAGQAAAGASATDKFHASLQNTEVTIGTLMLPALDNMLTKLTDATLGVQKLADELGKLGKLKLGGIFGGSALRTGADAIPGLHQALSLFDAFRELGKGQAKATDIHPNIIDPETMLKVTHAAAQLAAANEKIAKAKPATVDQRNNWFDAMISRQLGRVQDVTSLKAQNARLRVIAGELEARVKVTKDITRRLTLQAQVLDILRDIRANNDQLAQDQADAIEAKKQEALGWAQFAEERAGATKSLQDDLHTAEDTLALLKKQAGVGKRSLDEARQIWEQEQKIAQIKKDIRDQQKKDRQQGHGVFSAAGFVSQLGIGLTAAQARALSAKLAGGMVRPLTSGAPVGFGGQTTVISGGVHLYGVQDARKLEGELTRRTRARAKPRRGV